MIAKKLYTSIRYKIFIRKRKAKHYDKIFSHLTSEEKRMLHLLALDKTGIFVEIGSYLGASSCFIALAQVHKNPFPKLYCVDTWTNDAMSEGARDTFDLFLKNTKDFKGIIHPIRGKSTIVAEHFRERIDFLFVDGDHSYEGVKADIHAWFPKLNPEALVAFHDIGWAEGVKRAVEEDVEPIAKKSSRLPNLYWAYL
jgi:predicted O-methyltransferase YrrM